MVRVAIVGLGNMGGDHARRIHAGTVEGMTLAAVCDINPAKITRCLDEIIKDPSVPAFENTDALFAHPELYDCVIIATPHYAHPEIAIRAFELKKHVVCEKPAGVYTKQVRAMMDAAEKAGTVFSMMYNQRTKPMYIKVKQMIDNGELGALKRFSWVITNWYRCQSYHDSGSWRSSWGGEGGGVLMNQDPHQLDMWQWMVGMPKKVRGFARFGHYYNIEVEDDVTVYCEYENGMSATFISSTGEAPGTNRLEIAGDMGKVVVEGNKITFFKNEISEREFNRTYKGGFGAPRCEAIDIPYEEAAEKSEHNRILQNVVDAIENGAPLVAPGMEGIRGLTISNAIHLSSWLDDWVELPLDEDLYYEKLCEKIASSSYKAEDAFNDKALDVRGTH